MISLSHWYKRSHTRKKEKKRRYHCILSSTLLKRDMSASWEWTKKKIFNRIFSFVASDTNDNNSRLGVEYFFWNKGIVLSVSHKEIFITIELLTGNIYLYLKLSSNDSIKERTIVFLSDQDKLHLYIWITNFIQLLMYFLKNLLRRDAWKGRTGTIYQWIWNKTHWDEKMILG